jgi:hypothetical protein
VLIQPAVKQHFHLHQDLLLLVVEQAAMAMEILLRAVAELVVVADLDMIIRIQVVAAQPARVIRAEQEFGKAMMAVVVAVVVVLLAPVIHRMVTVAATVALAHKY